MHLGQMIDEMRLVPLLRQQQPPKPSHERMIIAATYVILHKNLASTMRPAHDAFAHTAII
jgi:hypothetical protein